MSKKERNVRRSGWPLILRIIGTVVAIEVIIGGLTLLALLDNAREAVMEELRASERLALGLVRATLKATLLSMPNSDVMEQFAITLPSARHVRFLVVNGRGDLRRMVEAGREEPESEAPDWLVDLLDVPLRTSEVALIVAGRLYGKVLVVADPRDEIAEVWRDFREILGIAGLGFLLLTASVWAVTIWALRPLRSIREALEQARSGNTRIRLGATAVAELEPIIISFNALMEDLEQMRLQREELTRRLVAAEDAERRVIALELHDEIGPCLFALRSEVASLLRKAGRDPDPLGIGNRCEAILHVARTLEEAHRRVLARLRPVRAPWVTFSQQLDDLLADCAVRAPDISWRVEIDPELDGASEIVQITIYRILQEALTNVLRHADASRVEIEVRRESGGFRVTVTDDGRGFVGMRPDRIGLHGMRERVCGLGGRFHVESAPGCGTTIFAEIPDVRESGPEHGREDEPGVDEGEDCARDRRSSDHAFRLFTDPRDDGIRADPRRT